MECQAICPDDDVLLFISICPFTKRGREGLTLSIRHPNVTASKFIRSENIVCPWRAETTAERLNIVASAVFDFKTVESCTVNPLSKDLQKDNILFSKK